jgi:hypothetical protein
MNKTIKLGMATILYCGSICSGHSSCLIDENTKKAVKTLETFAGEVIQGVCEEKRNAAERGFNPFWQTRGLGLWIRTFAEKIEQQSKKGVNPGRVNPVVDTLIDEAVIQQQVAPKRRVTLKSLIDSYLNNGLADEGIYGGPSATWDRLRAKAERAIPMIRHIDDLEHSLFGRHIKAILLNNVGSHYGARDFAEGWETCCNPRPSPQLSEFISDFRTYLFGDHIAIIKSYLHNYLLPVLTQLEQYRDQAPLQIDDIVSVIQRLLRSEIDLAIRRQIVDIRSIESVGKNTVGEIEMIARDLLPEQGHILDLLQDLGKKTRGLMDMIEKIPLGASYDLLRPFEPGSFPSLSAEQLMELVAQSAPEAPAEEPIEEPQ